MANQLKVHCFESTLPLISWHIAFLSFCALLSGCVMGIPSADEFHHVEPKERCIPVIVDGVMVDCVPESRWGEWAQKNGL